MPAVDVIIQAAQLAVKGRFTNASKQQINHADQQMPLASAQACLQHDKQLIYTSGYFNYGDCGANWIDKMTPPSPSPLGESHTQVVVQLLQLHRQQGLHVVVLSLGFVYGPGGCLRHLFMTLYKKGRFVFLVRGQTTGVLFMCRT